MVGQGEPQPRSGAKLPPPDDEVVRPSGRLHCVLVRRRSSQSHGCCCCGWRRPTKMASIDEHCTLSSLFHYHTRPLLQSVIVCTRPAPLHSAARPGPTLARNPNTITALRLCGSPSRRRRHYAARPFMRHSSMTGFKQKYICKYGARFPRNNKRITKFKLSAQLK